MADLTQFLRDRYTEAREVEEGKWRSIPSPFDNHKIEWRHEGDEITLLVDDDPYSIELYRKVATKPDPDQFTLDDLDAKQRIVDAYLPPGESPHPGQPCINYDGQDPDEYDEYDSCSRSLEASKRLLHHDYVLRLLARPYRSHPDFDASWLDD